MNTTFEQILHEANKAYLEGFHGLAAFYVELCKVSPPRKSPQQKRQAKKDSHNPFYEHP